MSIHATKTIEEIRREQLGDGTEETLPRVLGPNQLIMLGVGAVIGTGIFVLTGQAAAANAGPAIVISMVLAGLTSVLAALCYSEFAASVPVAGSAYTYAYATLGEFVAWIIGWDLILEYALGAATVAVGWSGNFVTLLGQLGMTFPAAISAAPGHRRPDRRRRPGDGRVQPAGCRHHRRRHAAADHRRQRISQGQRRHRRHQGRGRPGRHRRRRVLHRSATTAIRSSRRIPGRSASTAGAASCAARRDLLRLHRLRRRLDVGAGGQEPPARHAARHPRIAGHLHHPLRARVGGDGRPRALQGDAERAGAARRRHRGRRRRAPPGRRGRA